MAALPHPLVFAMLAMSPATALAQHVALDEALLRAVEEAEASQEIQWHLGPGRGGDGGAWIANNREHGFRAVFGAHDVELHGSASGEPWTLSLALEAWGRAGESRELAPASLTVSDARAEYRREDLVEWYENDARGLEQGFDLLAPPPTTRECGPLELRLRAAGDVRLECAADGRSVLARDACGELALSYAELRAWDATGARLETRLELCGGALTITLDDEGATYPIAVDPLLASMQAKLIPANNAAGRRCGRDVDIDGDTAAVLASGSSGPWVVYVFERTGTTWTQTHRLANPFANNTIAHDVDLEGDLLVVGFDYVFGAADQGGVDVFERVAGSWSFRDEPSTGNCCDLYGEDVDVLSPTCFALTDDFIGTAVHRKQVSGGWPREAVLARSASLAGRGDLLVVGQDLAAPTFRPYQFNGTSWVAGPNILTTATGSFGTHVPVAMDEDASLAIGDHQDDTVAPDAGAIYVMRRAGTGWVQWAKLLSPDFPSTAGFGSALDFEGGTLAVGCPKDDTAGVDAGAVYLFRRNGGWKQQLKLLAPDAAAGDEFGIDVSVENDTLLVGAHRDDNAFGVDAGSAYVFTLAHDAEVYCTAKVNSLGCLPEIDFAGTPSVSSASPFVISARKVLSNKLGVFYYGVTGRAAFPFDGGTQCVAGSVRRTGMFLSGGNFPPTDCSGVQSIDFNARIQSGIDPNLVAGMQVNGQFWTRDGGVASGTGLSDGIEFEIQP